MKTPQRTPNERFHLAAKAIESDGREGFQTAAKYVGPEAAWALLISHVRRAYGSMKTWPAEPIIDDQTDELLCAQMPEVYGVLSRPVALFYTPKWYCFDNFSAFAVKWRGQLYPTVEHAYQAAKYLDDNVLWLSPDSVGIPVAEIIRNATSAHEAKRLGNHFSYRHLIPEGSWTERKKLSVMEELLRAKRAQHEYVQKKLTESKGIRLIEDSNTDPFWGRGPNWDGQNWLGRLWMKIRDE